MNTTRSLSIRWRYGRIVLVGGLGLIALAVLWLASTGNTNLRYSADFNDTVPMWTLWIPPMVGLVLVRLMPPRTTSGIIKGVTNRHLATQSLIFLVAALLFPVLLFLALSISDGINTGLFQGSYVSIKLVLLLAVPLTVLYTFTDGTVAMRANRTAQRRSLGRWYWLGPIVPVVVWFYLSYATPLAIPVREYAWPDLTTMILAPLIGFFINAVVEELFYRVWLQSRLELLWGRWPATVLASLIWASWHMVLQGGTGLVTDLAQTFANQGVTGLFLGYLWSRYGNVWTLLLIHGAMNSVSILLALL